MLVNILEQKESVSTRYQQQPPLAVRGLIEERSAIELTTLLVLGMLGGLLVPILGRLPGRIPRPFLRGIQDRILERLLADSLGFTAKRLLVDSLGFTAKRLLVDTPDRIRKRFRPVIRDRMH
jgi:hypothetical protein